MIPFGDNKKLPIFPLVVYALIVINVLVFFQETGARDTDAFINAFASIPYDLTHQIQLPPPSPQPVYLTLVTAMFLHGSVLHIFFNMLFLFVFGPEIEYLFGHVRFTVFYLLAGIIGNVAQIAIDPGSHVPAIGASGAIAGVLGAYIIKFPTAKINTVTPIGCFPLFLRLPAALVIGIWALTQFIHGYTAITTHVTSEQGGGTAYFAHIGGFVAGVLFVSFFTIRTGSARRYRYYY
jgi:membrane associated rhomboid family serine protease